MKITLQSKVSMFVLAVLLCAVWLFPGISYVEAASTNIALNKPATASSEEASKGNYIKNGNDGSTSTKWTSGGSTFPQWWCVDLQSNHDLTGTEIQTANSSYVYKYKIEVSSDNSNWTMKVDKTTNTVAQTILTDNFTASNVRYVKITFTGVSNSGWASMYEFRVFGTASGGFTANDRFVTVTGAGLKDGTSWANAFEGDKAGGLQAAWDATPANGTLYVGSGTYDIYQQMNITTSNDGSSSTSLKRLVGYNTGSGLPYFTGTWQPGSTDTTKLISVASGASYWVVKDIKISNYYAGIETAGKNVCFRIYNVDVSYMSDGLYLRGGATKVPLANADAKNYNTDGSHDIIIEDCDFDHYTKRGVRFRDGNYNAVVRRCTGDGGGQAFWRSGNFQFSFQVADSSQHDDAATNGVAYDHNIEFHDCIGKNNWVDSGATSYWNGDGFVTERASDNIKFYNCKAFDNTDGGWDCKSKRVYLYDCVSARNKRAYRFWSREMAQLNNCIGIYSEYKGGTTTHCGVWAYGNSAEPTVLEMNYCTIYNNYGKEIQNEGGYARITANNSIIGQDYPSSQDAVLYPTNQTLNNCDVYVKGEQGIDPRFVNPVSTWNGIGTNWNSQEFGQTKGYYQAP